MAAREHEPARESLQEYHAAMQKTMQLCTLLEVQVDVAAMERQVRRAKYVNGVYAAGSKAEQISGLKRAAADLLVTDGEDPGRAIDFELVIGHAEGPGCLAGRSFLKDIQHIGAGHNARPCRAAWGPSGWSAAGPGRG
jgi:hypothetical protein